MEKQFDNSVTAFTRPSPTWMPAAVASAVFLCLAAGAIAAVAFRNWPFAAIFVIALVPSAVLYYLAQRGARRLAAAAEGLSVGWNSAQPELQRQTLNVEVVELSRLLDVGVEQMGDLQSAYIVAEDLALRQIQIEENAPLIRHASIGGVPFDAVLTRDGLIVCVEVSFLVAPDLRQDKIDAVIKKAAKARKSITESGDAHDLRLMFLLVTQLTPQDEEVLRSRLKTSRFSGTPVDIEIRFLDFEALQKIFIAE